MEFIIIVLGLIADRLTKIWAVRKLTGGHDIVVVKNLFDFSYLENRGAAFGFLQGKQILLSIITLIVIIGVIYYLFRYKPASKLFRVSIALIIGGALGNLFDRLYYRYVVDFIVWHYKDVYYWPTFNIADTLVVVGTFLLGIYIIKDVK